MIAAVPPGSYASVNIGGRYTERVRGRRDHIYVRCFPGNPLRGDVCSDTYL